MKSRHEIESIQRGRKKLRLTVILSSAFLLVLAAIITFVIIIGGVTSETEPTTPPEIMDGEAIYRGNTVAFPAVNADSIFRISVNIGSKPDEERVDGEFTFVKDEMAGGDFLFSYVENGEIKIFYRGLGRI